MVLREQKAIVRGVQLYNITARKVSFSDWGLLVLVKCGSQRLLGVTGAGFQFDMF